MAKILCVIDSLEAGGAQRQLVGLAVSFKELGYEVHFLTYHDIPFYLKSLHEAGITYNNIEETSYIKRLLKIRKFIRKGNFDVVLSFLESPSFICELAGFPFKRWKLIVGERNANPKIKTSLKSIIFRFFHLFSDKVVANSYTNLGMVTDVNPFLPKRKLAVVYNMVDFEKWKPSQRDIYKKEGEFLSLIVAGRHAYQKNLSGLIDAVSMMDDKKRHKLKITWYGDKISPPYYDHTFPNALKKIRDMGIEDNFTFCEATPNIIDEIQQADVIGLFSHYEGFPNIICEAMACGKPVIASKVSDIPRIIDDEHFTFDQRNVLEIVRVLEYVLTLSKERLIEQGKKNREIALGLFDRATIVSRYQSIVAELLNS